MSNRLKSMTAGVALILAMAGLLCAEIVIIVKDQNGREVARLRVPDGSSVSITRGEPGAAPALTTPDDQTRTVPKLKQGALLEDYHMPVLLERRGSFKAHRSSTYALAFSPQGTALATSSKDCTAKVWALPSQELLQTIREHTGWVQDVEFSPDGGLLVSSGLHSPSEKTRLLRAWNAKTNELTWSAGTSLGAVSLAFSPDGEQLATGDWEERSISIFDAESGDRIAEVQAISAEAGGPGSQSWATVAYSPDGRYLAAVVSPCRESPAGEESQLSIWDARTHALLTRFVAHNSMVWSLAFSPDSRWLATAGNDRTVKLWAVPEDGAVAAPKLGGPLEERRPIRIFAGHAVPVISIAFHPNGRTLAAGCALFSTRQGQIRLWDLNNTARPDFETNGLGTLCVAFSPDGNLLASGEDDGSVTLWDVKHLGRAAAESSN